MGGDYLQLLSQFPFENTLALLLLIMLRVTPIVIFAPFLGGRLLPSATKIGFALFLSIILLPFLVPTALEDLMFGFPLVLLCMKELFIGYLIGFLCSIPFHVATSAGSMIDHQRGSASLMVTDPSLTSQTSPIGMFLNEILLVGFFVIGGIHLFFETLVASFQRIPPTVLVNITSFNQNIFWKMAVELMEILFVLAVRFSAPAIVAMLMADIFLGIANRLAPQVQIAFLGMPLKSLLGLVILFIGFHFLMYQMDQETLLWFKKLYQMFSVFPNPST